MIALISVTGYVPKAHTYKYIFLVPILCSLPTASMLLIIILYLER